MELVSEWNDCKGGFLKEVFSSILLLRVIFLTGQFYRFFLWRVQNLAVIVHLNFLQYITILPIWKIINRKFSSYTTYMIFLHVKFKKDHKTICKSFHFLNQKTIYRLHIPSKNFYEWTTHVGMSSSISFWKIKKKKARARHLRTQVSHGRLFRIAPR